jgi:hypothetical protein
MTDTSGEVFTSLKIELYREFVAKEPLDADWPIKVATIICEMFPDDPALPNDPNPQYRHMALHNISWMARIKDHSALQAIDSIESLGAKLQSIKEDTTDWWNIRFALSLIYLHSAKFSFDYERVDGAMNGPIVKFVNVANLDLLKEFPIFQAFDYFAKFGNCSAKFTESLGKSGIEYESFKPAPPVEGGKLKQLWRDSPDGITKQVVLHAIWLTPLDLLSAETDENGNDEWAWVRRFLIEAAEELSLDAGETQVALYRLAYGLWANGDLEEALRTMNKVLSHSSRGDSALFEQYLTVRNAIQQELRTNKTMSRNLVKSKEAFDEDLGEAKKQIAFTTGETIEDKTKSFKTDLKKLSEDAQDQIDGSLFRVVEILGVFVALIAVVATTVGALRLEGLDGLARAGIVVLGCILPLGYFVALQKIVRKPVPGRGSKSSRDASTTSDSSSAKPMTEKRVNFWRWVEWSGFAIACLFVAWLFLRWESLLWVTSVIALAVIPVWIIAYGQQWKGPNTEK